MRGLQNKVAHKRQGLMSEKIVKNLLLLLFVWVIGMGSSGIVSADMLPATITGTVTINPGDVIGNLVDFDVTIQSGGHLIINPGVTLEFENDKRITVDSGGTLTVMGSGGAAVTLKARDDLNGWYGLYNNGGNISISYANISQAEYCVFQLNGKTEVYSSTIQDCHDGIKVMSGQIIIKDGNTFTGNTDAIWLEGATQNTSQICGNRFIDNNPSIILNKQNNVEIRSNRFEDRPSDMTIKVLEQFNNSNLYIANNSFICAGNPENKKNTGYYFIENLCGLPVSSINIVTVYNSYWKCGSTVYQSETAIKNDGLVNQSENVFIKGFSGDDAGTSDSTPPVLEEISPATSNPGLVRVVAVISDVGWGVNPDSVLIRLKNPSNVTVNPTGISYVCNNRQYIFYATFSLSVLGDYSYIIAAQDAAGNSLNDKYNLIGMQKLTVSNNVNSVTTPSLWPTGSYFMATFPITATVLDHRTALNLTAPDSSIVSYEPGHGYYYYGQTGLAPITPGRGFWLKLGSTESVAARSIAGTIVAADEGTQVADLTPGWHMIGSPFTTGFNIDHLSFTYTSPTKGANYTGRMTEAVNDGAVSFGFWGYNSNGYYLERTHLNPWEGYWILVKKTCRINYHTGVFTPTSNIAAPLTWEIQLTAVQGSNSDSANYLGLTRTSVSGVDIYDLEKPPSFGNKLKSFLTPQGATAEYGADIRSGSSRRERWIFTVSGLEPGAATISWRGLGDVPYRYTLTINDLTTGRQVNLRNSSSYQFTAGAEESRQFEVVMTDLGTDAVAITGIGLSSNPFAPLRESLIITYTLSSDAVVNTRIYDWVGNLVYIYPSANNAIGPNSMVWNGRNNLGRMVANGIYFCKITARSGSAQNTQIVKIAVVN